MYVARVLYPVEVLGPGKRVGIWFCGCPRRCPGCSNPELWEFQEKYKTTPQRIYELIRQVALENPVDGFTITGGDPMYQPEALRDLIALLRNISDDILVYTGYQLTELPRKNLKGIAVLIDGEYIESRNTNCILRGSDNQIIHVMNPEFEDRYRMYCEHGENQIQNFTTGDGIISVGIHKPNFMNELNDIVKMKGLNTDE